MLFLNFRTLTIAVAFAALFPSAVHAQVIRDQEDNDIRYRIVQNEEGTYQGEIFDPILERFKQVPLKGLPNDCEDAKSLRDRSEINFTVCEEKNGSDLEDFSAGGIHINTSKEKSSRDESNFPSETVKVISERSLKVIPFSNCIECRQLQSQDGRVAQFNEKRDLGEQEIAAIENLNIPWSSENEVGITNGGILFEKRPTQFFPKTNDDIIKIIELARKFGRKIRVVGSMHSLNPICHTNDYMISLEKMNKVIEVGENSCTVEGGIVIRDLCTEIEKSGLALAVLGSICEQTITGAIATGTRGQVPSQGSLASLVTHIEIIDGKGVVKNLTLKDHKDQLCAVATGLGLMGIITKVTLKCVPLFLMTEVIRLINIEDVIAQLNELKQCEKLVMYWNVDGQDVKVVTGHKVDCDFSPKDIASFKTLGNYPHMHSMENFPDTLQRIGKSWELITLLQWTKEKGERRVRQMIEQKSGIFQSDYSIPEDQFVPLLQDISKFFRENRSRLKLFKDRMVVEIRPVKSDDVWLSPSYGRDSFSLCFHDFERGLDWDNSSAENFGDSADFREFENLLKRKYNLRPHLGKAHFFSNRDLHKAFPKWQKFKELRTEFDPDHIFLTDYLFQMFSDSERIF